MRVLPYLGDYAFDDADAKTRTIEELNTYYTKGGIQSIAPESIVET